MDFQRDLRVVSEPQVLVCGAGCAGVGAAIAAAEMGASVMVVESSGFAGGFITAVGGPGLDGMYDTKTGEIVVGGIAKDIMEKVSGVDAKSQLTGRFTYGGDLTAESGVDHGKTSAVTGLTPVDMNPEHFKVYADRRFVELGIEVLYHTRVIDVVSTGREISYVVIANKGGLSVIKPHIVIDCTGDADVAAWSGNTIMTNPDAQPMSLHLRLGNVDITDELIAKCSRALEEAHSAGKIAAYGGPWALKMGPGDIAINATRIVADRTDPRAWTFAEMEGRRQAWDIFNIWRESVEECKDAYYIASGPEAGARETRRIRGKYILTGEDIVENRPQPDAVVKGAWYFDQHPSGSSGFHEHRDVRPYDIPFRTLVPDVSTNLLVAGRCHSATPQALASSRVTATSMGMGEAAGTAAGLVVGEGSKSGGLDSLDYTVLRASLKDRGAILD